MRNVIAGIAINILLLFGWTTIAFADSYEVKEGDSLWKIAKEHDTSVAKIIQLNDLKSIMIHPNQTLQLHEIYEVKKGDTLSHISLEYGVAVQELMEWNDLESDLILIGQELTIKESKQTDLKRVKANRKDASDTRRVEDKQTVQATAQKEPNGRTFSVVATAYTAECDGCTGITYTGINLNNDRHAKVIAVDPSVIPLGSEVYVEGYGRAIAGDIGGAIKGNRIDIHVPTKEEAYQWGVREVEITILDE